MCGHTIPPTLLLIVASMLNMAINCEAGHEDKGRGGDACIRMVGAHPSVSLAGHKKP